MSQTSDCAKKLDYLCNCKSEISNVGNAVEAHCLQAMKIGRHYANSCFDWLISGQQSVDPREAISYTVWQIQKFYVGGGGGGGCPVNFGTKALCLEGLNKESCTACGNIKRTE